MEVQYKSKNGRMQFKITGDNAKDIFKELAEIQEVLEADSACGACGKDCIVFRFRVIDDNAFYDLFCLDCKAALTFGQHKKGDGMWAKRVNPDTKEAYPNRGWKKWQKSDESGF